MIAKTVIGSTIGSALAYGAGELGERSRQQKAEKVDLLATYNLSAQAGDSPKQVHREMADEMKAVVRDHPGRCQNPVWHTSLSMPSGQTLDAQAWTKAVEIYLRAVGIDARQHQVAVFRHRDTAHDHVHIYANRVGMDGGAAVKTGWNYKANVKATRQIEQALNLTPVTNESKRTSLKDHLPQKQLARDVVAQALKSVLDHERPTTLEELVGDLEKHRITVKLHANSQGPTGISFQAVGHQAVKGTAVGYKFNQLSVLLDANRAEYESEINRLRDEAGRAAEAKKSREIAEKALENAKQEIQEVYEKRDLVRDAFHKVEEARQQEEKARQQAEQERNAAREYAAKLAEVNRKNYEIAIGYQTDNDRLKQEKAALEEARKNAEKARGQAVEGWSQATEELEKMIDVANDNSSYLIAERKKSERLEQANRELRQKLQASPTPQQITDRVQQFYLIASPGPKGEFGENYSGQKNAGLLSGILGSNAVPAIAAYLAHDFPNPQKAATAIGQRFTKDWESYRTPNQGVGSTPFSFVPVDKMNAWYKKPDREQKIGWQQEPSGEAWQKLVAQKLPDGLLRKLARLSDHSLEEDSPKQKQPLTPKPGFKLRNG